MALCWGQAGTYDMELQTRHVPWPLRTVSLSCYWKLSMEALVKGVGDSMTINRNSKLYTGIRRTYDQRQVDIQSEKRYRQVNARKGNHTFRVRLGVKSIY
jgi:hypothetical protein